MTVSPFITTGQEAGLSNTQYIRRLRELLDDIPKPADEQASGLGNAKRYNFNIAPINDDQYCQIFVGGTQQQIIQVDTPTGNEVYVDFDTGRTIFGTPPPALANNINFYKNTVRWRDSTLLEALTDGARNMWPKLGRIAYDTSLSISVNVWQYQLPPIFNDPNVRLIDVSIREVPESTERFIPLSGWWLSGLNQLQLPTSQGFSPGATIMLEYEAPYASLSEVESKAQALPLWYAAGMLLGFKESRRVRTDTANVTTEAQANPVGAQSNAGSFYMRQFYTALSQMARVRRAPRIISTYQE